MEMHATVRSYGGVPEFADALKANEGEVKRLLEGIPGFRAYYLIRTGASDVVSVSVYDDEAGTTASTAAAREWIAANLHNFSPSPPQVSSGDVVIQA